MPFLRKNIILALCAASLSGCFFFKPVEPGKNAAVLDAYTNLGKNMDKPEPISNEDQDKESTEDMIKTAAEENANTLNKSMSSDSREDWLVEEGISRGDAAGTIVYYQIVDGRPCERATGKYHKGRYEVSFSYPGEVNSLYEIDTTQITDILSWKFTGREYYDWKSQIDSINALVTFAQTEPGNTKPGTSLFWGKNISATESLGKGDTAYISVDSLDDNTHTQYGRGSFLDANNGEGDSFAFNFDMEIIHKNTQDSDKPYQRYQDNEGVARFTLPWWGTDDSLYYEIHFYPEYLRSGVIRKNSEDGEKFADFVWDVKEDTGTVNKYYDEDGNL